MKIRNAMFRRLFFSTLLAIALHSSLPAQYSNNWYFGFSAAISFTPQGNTPLPYELSNSAMTALEGCASASDANGNLLFYTNGETVYNKFHQVMPGGTGLMGHVSSFQSCVIVPMPNTDNIFYIFTADAFENNYANGYTYSVVDTRANGGNGQVLVKNQQLNQPGTERLTAARHRNGVDVWVITNELNSNRFYAYLITCSGIQAAPVISDVGDVLDQHQDMPFGAMKVSPDGTQLCQTHFPELDAPANDNFFQIFDFDNATGVLSNPKKITVPGNRYHVCEYSPDSRFLYVTKVQRNEIDQFEAKLPDAVSIAQSRVSIPAESGFFGLQAAPDNKIYGTHMSPYLTVIHDPNIKGPGCNLELDKMALSRHPGISLPQFVNDLAVNQVMQYTILDSCQGRVQFDAVTNMPGPLTYLWDFGDGTTSGIKNPVHTFPTSSDYYVVRLRITSPSVCGYIDRSLNVLPGGLDINPGFDFVVRCDSGYVRFVNTATVPPGGGAQWLWDFGDGSTSTDKDPVHVYPARNTYPVKLKISTSPACLDDSITRSVFVDRLDIQASPDQTIDLGQSVQLFVNGGGTRFQWTPSTGLSNPSIPDPVAQPEDDISYIVTASTEAGCVDRDTVFIKVIAADSILVPGAFTPNNDGLNDIIRPYVGPRYTLKEFSVYNRWGQLMFTTSQRGAGWNGKRSGVFQDTGVYIWVVKALRGPAEIRRKGSFVLIR